jgi:putative membrane protein
MSLFITWIANTLAIYLVAYFMTSVQVASFRDACIAGAVLSLVNLIVKPIVFVLTLPFTIVTLGLFYFVVTAFCLWLVSYFVAGFAVRGFFMTAVASIIISIVSAVINRALTKGKE